MCLILALSALHTLVAGTLEFLNRNSWEGWHKSASYRLKRVVLDVRFPLPPELQIGQPIKCQSNTVWLLLLICLFSSLHFPSSHPSHNHHPSLHRHPSLGRSITHPHLPLPRRRRRLSSPLFLLLLACFNVTQLVACQTGRCWTARPDASARSH